MAVMAFAFESLLGSFLFSLLAVPCKRERKRQTEQRYGRAISLFSIPLFRASVISDYYPIKGYVMLLTNFGTKIAGSVLFPG